jgi:methylated-DNA-[protein]-cysteine S-methyltransferase
MHIEWNSYRSPVGGLTLIESDCRPIAVEFAPQVPDSRWVKRLRTQHPRASIDTGLCQATRTWLDAYFAGGPLPFRFPEYLGEVLKVSPDQDGVWRALCEIPVGETRSYQDIARITGLHPRQVGQLNRGNHLAILIPCHRVVGKNGSLVGFGGGLPIQRWLLDHELRITGVRLGSPGASGSPGSPARGSGSDPY